MALSAGDRLGRYEILAPIGAGGMGEVYRALDPGLEREIALKVLPADSLGDGTARARMVREARMAAKLNHPNISTIHEVGEADGQVHIAMELVEGHTLAETMTIAGGALPSEQALSFGAQVADALTHAHGRGVVHRDLKSANVIITPEGRVKVLDFGLAKQLAGEGLSEALTQSGASLTTPGTVIGTLPYMAPEQLRGYPSDARSDIWALGVVLYEMLGGRRPFAAPTGFALSDAILNSSPKPLPAGVPAAARTVIERCLAKAPSERFQSAVEVRAALETVLSGRAIPASMHRTSRLPRYRWWLAAAAAAAIVAVLGVLDAGGLRRWLPGGGGRPRVVRMAVLPFVNLTGDPEQEYLSDGFTQEMISQLGRLHPDGLSVIARASVMRYKAGDTPIDQIGRELNVDYVLEGSARREANLVRISAELIHVRDQTQIWADTFERELAGILAVQSEVAQRVAQALALTLLPAEGARLAATRTVDPEAYEAYLKGTHHWQKATPADLDTAERYFELALEEDPSYAPAYEGLAWVWAVRQQFGIAPPHEAGPKAKTAALQAVALDEASAEAHEALALVRTWTDWDWAGAEPEWRRALEINPNGANAHAYYAHFLAIIGRTGEALQHSERALELDRFNGLFHGLYSLVLCFDQRFDEAVAAARAGLALQPHQPVALSALWLSAASAGLHKEAVAAGEVYLTVLYGDSALRQALDRGRAAGGYSEAMLRAATALAARYETSGAVPVDIAVFYVEAGEHGRALDWLEQAYRDRDPSLPYLGLPVFDPVRPDPRFKDLMRRMNLPTD